VIFSVRTITRLRVTAVSGPKGRRPGVDPKNLVRALSENSFGGLFFRKSRVYLVLDDNGTSDPFPGLKVQVTYTELLPSFLLALPRSGRTHPYNLIIESNVPKAFCSRSVLWLSIVHSPSTTNLYLYLPGSSPIFFTHLPSSSLASRDSSFIFQ